MYKDVFSEGGDVAVWQSLYELWEHNYISYIILHKCIYTNTKHTYIYIHLHLILISGQEPLYYPISLHTFGVYNGNDHDELS